MMNKKASVWLLSGLLLACGPRAGDGSGGDGDGDGDAGQDVGGEDAGVDLGDAGPDVSWALGFFYADQELVGHQLQYMEVFEDGTGLTHRISCYEEDLPPLPFRWEVASETEIVLYPPEGEEFVPSLAGATRMQRVWKDDEDGVLIFENGPGVQRVVRGWLCNVEPIPRASCPLPGFEKVEVCDE